MELPPKTVDPLWVVTTVTIYYSIIFLSGMVGNLLACLVIAHNKHMHTITNYYLFSMSVSDMLLLVWGIPHEIYFMWNSYPYIFGDLGCFLNFYLVEVSYNATAMTITAFTIERYIAICHPFLSHTVSSLSRAFTSIAFIWSFAFLSALPQALQVGKLVVNLNSTMVNVTQEEELSFCTIKLESLKSVWRYSLVISSVLFFLVPLVLITVLYSLIGLRLHSTSRIFLVAEQDKALQVNISNSDQHARSTKRVIKMLVAVVVAFFICWAPLQAQRLLAVFKQPDMHDEHARFMWYFSGLLYFSSTTVNPILYNIMSHKFRDAFKRTLTSCPGGVPHSRGHQTSLKWRTATKTYCSRDSKNGNGSNTEINIDQHQEAVRFKKCIKQDSVVSSKTTASSTISSEPEIT